MNNPLRMRPENMRIAGHRGHSYAAPENTYAAFELARKLGGAGVTCETDLALTRDGQLLLIHDETVDRTTNGHGLVRNMTSGDLLKLDAGSWFSPEFSGERIPTLRDALEFARKNDIIYQLEVKVYNRNDEVFPKLKAVVDDMKAYDLLQFSAFDFTLLKELKQFIPKVPTVGLSHSILIDPAAPALDANVDAVNLEILNFPSMECIKLHQAGIAVFLHIPVGEILDRYSDYGWNMRSDIINWIRDGHLDQVISNDVSAVVSVWHEAIGK
ncbi:MAG: phosphodiesterase [Clostridia bacterium]|nr:phosphodiesterase [Clostridia bacterium]